MISRKDIRFTKIRNHKGWTIHYAHLDWFDMGVAEYSRGLRLLRKRVLARRRQLDSNLKGLKVGMEWIVNENKFMTDHRVAARHVLSIMKGEILNNKGQPTVEDLAEEVIVALLGGEAKTPEARNKYFWKRVDDGRITKDDVSAIAIHLYRLQRVAGHPNIALFFQFKHEQS